MASLQRELQFARDQSKREQPRRSKPTTSKKGGENVAEGTTTRPRNASSTGNVEAQRNVESQGSQIRAQQDDNREDVDDDNQSPSQDVSQPRAHGDDTQSSITTDNPGSASAVTSTQVPFSYPTEPTGLQSLNIGEANREYGSPGTLGHTGDNLGDSSKRYSLQIEESPLAGEDPSDTTGFEPSFSDTYVSGRKRFWEHHERPHRSSGMASSDNYAESYLESSLLERLSRSSAFDSGDNSPLSLVCKASSSTSNGDIDSTSSNHEVSELFGQTTTNYSDSLWNHNAETADAANENTRTLISSVVEEALSVTHEEDNHRRRPNYSFRLEHLDNDESQFSPVQTAPAHISKKKSFFKEFDWNHE